MEAECGRFCLWMHVWMHRNVTQKIRNAVLSTMKADTVLLGNYCILCV